MEGNVPKMGASKDKSGTFLFLFFLASEILLGQFINIKINKAMLV